MTIRCFLAAVAASGASFAHADVILVGPTNQFGAGFGNVLNLLSLQNRPEQLGSVLWNGTTDVLTGDATNQSQTLTVAELAAAGVTAVSDLGVVFNINEPGSANSLTLQEFEVVFQSASGAELFTQAYTGPVTLQPVGQGTGGAGYLFDVNLTAAQVQQFFADSTNRIAMRVESPITGSAGGMENFYVVPAPASLALMAMAAAVTARRRRRLGYISTENIRSRW